MRCRQTLASSTWLSLALLLLTSGAANSQDWPQLRGPSLDGSAPSERLEGAREVRFGEVWRRQLGSGYSAVSVVGQTAVTAATDGDRDIVVAFDATTGEPRWRFDLGPTYTGRNGSDDGPSSSPAIAAGRVLQLHPGGRLVALDLASGQKLWERHYVDDFGAPEPPYGFSSQPLVTPARVIVQPGGTDGRFVVVLEAATGDELWSAGDDEMEHQNPMLWSRDDGEQVVAVGRGQVAGYRLDDGDLLWRLELEGRGHAGDLTVVDRRRILLHRLSEDSKLIEVVAAESVQAEPLEARVLWTSRDLDGTYAIPIVRGGHVYGFDSRFLVCLDLETGERQWKSRPPGAQVFSVIGGQLLAVNSEGELVSAAISPEGYRQTGSLGLFRRRQVMTPVTAGAGLLFVRDLQEIVALRPHISSSSSDPESTRAFQVAGSPTGQSTRAPRFLRELLAEVGAEGLVARLEDRYPSAPVIQDNQAHFFWIGDQDDVAIVGDMTGLHHEVSLERLGQTSVRWASFDWRPVERWEYQFKLFEEPRLDPRNPLQLVGPQGERSVVVSEGWQAPPSCDGCARGDLKRHEIEGSRPGATYGLTVYTPSGYHEIDGRLPLALFTHGREALEYGEVANILDGLIARREIAPLIVGFVELPDAAWYPQTRERVAEIFDQEVLPILERDYRSEREPAQRAVLTQSWAFENTFHWLQRSSTFGKLAAQSPVMGEHAIERTFADRIDDRSPNAGLEAATPLIVRFDVGTSDQANTDWGLDVVAQTQALHDVLSNLGYDVALRKTPGGANWTRWAAQVPVILRDFFPLPDGAGSVEEQ